MINKLIRFYNQNKRQIIRTLLFVAVVIAIIQLANYFVKKNNEDKAISNITNSSTSTGESLQTKSIISETTISNDTAKKNNDTIKQFVDYCNEKSITEAYNMLSTDCKEEIFQTEEKFQTGYYNIIFNERKSYSKDNWMSSKNSVTYKITFNNDVLANGGNDNGQTYGDYITIIDENGEKKLNVASFVKKEEINKNYEDDNIKVEVSSKDIFIDYEIYKTNFTNNSSNIINLYDKNNNSKWYAKDSKNNTYDVTISEIGKEFLTINQKLTQTLNIKFLKTYNPDKNINKLCFENIAINNNLNNINIDL